MSKSFRISAAGLKNIVFPSSIDDDIFHFFIGDAEIEMKRQFADFISPRVSHIHQSDFTINSINFNDFICSPQSQEFQKLFTRNFINKLKQISEGYSVEIDEELSDQLRIFSILAENDELYTQIDELYPLETKKGQIDHYIQFLHNLKPDCVTFHQQQIFDFISANFSQIDESKLLKLPKRVLYSIISNEKIKVKNEDWLFDFIQKIYSTNNSFDTKEEISIEYFYEKLEIENLSENKFLEFIESLDSSEITRIIWAKLKNCFYNREKTNKKNSQPQSSTDENRVTEDEGKTTNILFDSNPNNRFKGVINHITNGQPKRAIEGGIINITASSYANDSHHPLKAIEYDNNGYFHTNNCVVNEWLCVDFKERKVRPSHYSLKSYARYYKNNFNLQTWVIEGSNDEKEWKTIDSRTNDRSLDDTDASNTFEIKNNSDNNEFYRYLRIRQTGQNTYTSTDYRMIVTSLEFFGSIKEA